MTAATVALRHVRPRELTARLGGRQAAAGIGILVVLILVALLAPVLAPHSPDAIDADHILAGPSWSHPFGFDALGRDVLSRVLFAYRASLGVSIGAVALALALGLPIGIVAGYFGGVVDNLLMRPIDLLLALPALLLAISLISITGPGELVALFAIATIYLPILARVVRSSVLAVSRELYVEGARARGVSHARTIWSHVVPNALGPAVVQASVLAGFALQIEAALSFLGLGAQPPTPSLGLMLADGYQVLQQAPWADIFPGLAIAITVVAFNLVGDGLRSKLDPRGISG
ncbi:MAG TPA: ABC transporter permease [Gaiellaceae bacterium]|jgi:peptide/nickel transport system permease protein|nr:ABC transporter permease [Gaiellaceae bacterium]